MLPWPCSSKSWRALNEAAGVLRVVFHGDKLSALDQNGDVLPPAVAELGHLSGIVSVLQPLLAAAGGQRQNQQQAHQ